MKVKEQSEKVGFKVNIHNTKMMASGHITSLQRNGETMEMVTNFIVFGSKITADGECSHEIKRHLLLGRKAMTNLDSILKADITLPKNVHLVKLWFFRVVMYECESWIVKKAEHQRIVAFELWCWRRLLRVPLTARRLNQSILKKISPECSLEGLMLKLKLQYFGHLMQRTNLLEKTMMLRKIEDREGDDRGWDGWIASSTRDHVFKQAPGVGDGQGSLACCRPWGSQRVRHDWVTELNWRDFYQDYIKNYYTLLLLLKN